MKTRRKRMNLIKNKKEYLVCRIDNNGEEGLAYLDPYSGNLSFLVLLTQLQSLNL